MPLIAIRHANASDAARMIRADLRTARQMLDAVKEDACYTGPARFGWRPVDDSYLARVAGANQVERMLAAVAALGGLSLRIESNGYRVSPRDGEFANEALDAVANALEVLSEDQIGIAVSAEMAKAVEAFLSALGLEPRRATGAAGVTAEYPLALHARPPGTETLNDQQLAVVLADSRRDLLVNAGAGAGKTHTLAHRLAYLLDHQGIAPASIITLTFTVAAREQIKTRLIRLSRLGFRHLDQLDVRTIHSLGWDILTEAAKQRATYLRPGFKILADEPLATNGISGHARPPFTDPGAALFAELDDGLEPEKRLQVYPELLDSLRSGHPLIGLHVCADSLPEMVPTPDGGMQLPGACVRAVWERYIQYLHESNSVDYAGMVSEAILALEHHETVRAKYTDALQAVIVDEFQDTSLAQARLLRALGTGGAVLNVVGDVDQTIMSFVGASTATMEQFQLLLGREDREPVLELPLEFNYRSDPPVLDLANHVIGRNPRRLAKQLRPRPDLEVGAPYARPTRVSADSLQHAASWIGSTIRELLNQGVAAESIAVLYRKETETFPQRTRVLAGLAEHGIPVADPELDRCNGVRVSTVHSAKGREFDVVFVLFLDRNQFPDQRCDPAEERRLLYVAITRARHQVYMVGRRAASPPCFYTEIAGGPPVETVRVKGLAEELAYRRPDLVEEVHAEVDLDDWDDSNSMDDILNDMLKGLS